MWNFLKAIFNPSPTRVDSSRPPISPSESWILRGGESVRADDVFAAWTSRELPRMLAELESRTNKVDRHFLLMAIVSETYKHRSDEKMAEVCARVAEMHLDEFPQIAGPLRRDMDGILRRVTTFQHYATLLTEQSRFERAIEVCESAIRFGLHDGTKAGFEGRIERIKKKCQQRRKAN